jgi:uncharacterized membrane protein YphA (DoxX/SURF4 family)
MNTSKVKHTWLLLKVTYALAPLLLGLDKVLTGWIVDWSIYVSPQVIHYIPVTVAQLLLLVGIIEITAGVLVWFYPRFGAYIVATWMLLIIINLITMNKFYDIIARDAVIGIGALALAWLSEALKE